MSEQAEFDLRRCGDTFTHGLHHWFDKDGWHRCQPGWVIADLGQVDEDYANQVRTGADTAPDQDLINAATVIQRVANRPNRHPQTAAILLPIAEELRQRAFGMRQGALSPEEKLGAVLLILGGLVEEWKRMDRDSGFGSGLLVASHHIEQMLDGLRQDWGTTAVTSETTEVRDG